jgi:hypothetical protein
LINVRRMAGHLGKRGPAVLNHSVVGHA